MSEIAEKVKAIIVDKLSVEESEVVTDASFTNDLGADSLDTVELIMEFEKEFDISIPDDQAEKIQLPALPENASENLEKEIDRMTAMLPELKHFILPGGHATVSHIHIARTVCRRTERTATALAELSTVNPIFIQYLNRLSDYLFTLSRAAAHELGAEENKWVPKK